MKPVANRQRVDELVARGAHFYVGHSGGKDSWAQYIALREIIPQGRLHVVHADLGEVEWAGTKDLIRRGLARDGKPLLIAQAVHADGTPKTFFTAVRARREALDRKGQHDAPAFPSSAQRFCTSDLKTGPIWKVIRKHAAEVGATIVVNCVGIRADESPARAKRIASRGTLQVNAKNTTKSREAFDWWPIAHWSDAEVWAAIRNRDGIGGAWPVHPAYTTGNERLSCMFCIFGSRNDLCHAARENPELLAKYADLERDVRSTMFNGETLAERINHSTGGAS